MVFLRIQVIKLLNTDGKLKGFFYCRISVIYNFMYFSLECKRILISVCNVQLVSLLIPALLDSGFAVT